MDEDVIRRELEHSGDDEDYLSDLDKEFRDLSSKEDNGVNQVSRKLCYFSNLIHFFIFLIYLQFSSYNFLYMFRTGWSIIRRIKLHAQPLVPFPRDQRLRV